MPTVLHVHGLRFVIWLNDHAPAHVHVSSAEAEATIGLGERVDVAKALQGVFERRPMLQRRWREIYG